ncbi:MAG: hypothetical protein JSR56_07435 [Proteobacteria bacterium]|nr:hypothetical protein [Pseudomonadota bacterium]
MVLRIRDFLLGAALFAAAGGMTLRPGLAAGEEMRFGYLTKYQGQPLSSLLSEQAVSDALEKLVGEGRLAAIRAQGADAFRFTTVSRVGDHLVASGYRPKTGFANGAAVFISLKDGSARVCWTEDDQDTWFAPGAPPRRLTTNACIGDTGTLPARYGP